MKISRAFTLIELLVVIAIIAILAAILFPVFAQAKVAAKKTNSLSNIKQITLACIMYEGDFDDNFPSADEFNDGSGNIFWFPGDGLPLGWIDPNATQNWAAETLPYVKSRPLYVNPAAANITNNIFGVVPALPGANTSYDWNGAADRKNATSVSNPSKLMLFQATDGTSRDAYIQPTVFGGMHADGSLSFGHSHNPDGVPVCNGIDINWMGGSFKDGDVYGMSDGHAKYYKRDAVTWQMMGISSPWVWHFDGTNWTQVNSTTTLTARTPNSRNNWESWGQCELSSIP